MNGQSIDAMTIKPALRTPARVIDMRFTKKPASGGGSGSTFTGIAYMPGGTKFTGLDDAAKPWVKRSLSGNTITEEVGPPSFPWGPDEEWRLKADFAGAIYF